MRLYPMLLVFALIVACNPTSAGGVDGGPAPSPPVAAPDASSSCANACASLAAAGCPMGTSGSCASVLQAITSSGQHPNAATGKPLTCADVVGVKSKADAVAMGFACK